MGFIEREMDRIALALRAADEAEPRYEQLYVAQQALKWATEPQQFAAPLDYIERATESTAISNTSANSAGCLAETHLAPLSDTRG
jgi:hypothetical protein